MTASSNGNSTVGLKRAATIFTLAVFFVIAVFSLVAAGLVNFYIAGNLNQTTNTTAENSPTPTPTITPIITATPSPTNTPTFPPTSSPISPQWVTFTCHSGTPYQFTVTIQANLSDGMDSNEATAVAIKIFEHEITNATYAVKSAEADAAGNWKVNLSWELIYQNTTPQSLSHYFNVSINLLNQTVTYERCY